MLMVFLQCGSSIPAPASRVYVCHPDSTTSIDSNASNWIRDNFGCVTLTISNGNYVFETTSLPNHTSTYWGSTSDLYEEMPSGRTANSNLIAKKSYTFTLPANPVPTTSTTSTGPMGLTLNGVVIYNNTASTGDTIGATDLDVFEGHPDSSGTYHHHAAPTFLSNDDANLIGIALDGYAIYGRRDTGLSIPTDLDANHGHIWPTTYYPSGIYHYHYTEDTIAGIATLLGSNFKGTMGSVVNQ